MKAYVRESRRIRALLDEVSPLVEPISIDEAFFDLTGIAMDFEAAESIAHKLKDTLRSRIGLTGSIGLAPNKFLAKIASDLDKPDGLAVLRPDNLEQRFHPLEIERLWGVGPRMAERLHGGGLHRIGDLLNVAPERLERLVGERAATHLKRLARGEDTRPIEPHRRSKSISEERTYGQDLRGSDAIDRALLARAEGVARQLRKQGWVARTIHLKVRRGDFTTWTRSATLARATDLAEPIFEAARTLFRERIDLGSDGGVRLLGVGVSSLTRVGGGQIELFLDDDERRARKLATATDAVRAKIGEAGITRARLLKRPQQEEDEDGEASSLPAVDG